MIGEEITNNDLLKESEALFTINKAAKRAEKIYRNSSCNSGKCSKKKLGKKLNKLYEMKREIIEKAMTSEHAELRGIHSKFDWFGNKEDLLYYRFGKYNFHVPVDSFEKSNAPYLGEYVQMKYVKKNRCKYTTRKANMILSNWMLEYGDE
ncbi:YkyB family protein [Paenibacillus sp. O199]|uniref:YkyB family protein n=1 Tax=Paenibacillus sp. O199 TaxID=1643925 RepID=UPI0007BF1950|nr:YkyB family protein [Paenibacillus sp. O199]